MFPLINIISKIKSCNTLQLITVNLVYLNLDRLTEQYYMLGTRHIMHYLFLFTLCMYLERVEFLHTQ